ncbi:MAG TPA: PTS sugar transporter subunit IIA [Enterococcus columbae]|nr:PTS sugar transporter subunit IIA [Enterococcus columbae]
MEQSIDTTKPEEVVSKKQRLTSRLSYSFGAFGNDVFYATLSTYFIMFVTTHLFNTGNQATNDRMISYITFIIGALRIVELIIDPFIGNAIDRTNTKYGKFKPWVVIGGVISSIVLLVLFTNLGGLNQTNPFLYLAIFALLYITMDIFYSFKDIGFWSMIPALSFDSREREKTATLARIGSTIGGSIVGVVVMPLVLFFSMNKNNGTGDTQGWFWFAFIVALIGLISAIVVGIGTKEIDSALRKNKEQTAGIKEVFAVLTQNDQLMWVSLSYGLYATGINILNALQLYYFTFIMGQSTKFSILQTMNMIVGLVSVSLFPKLAGKFNRRNLFIGCIVMMLCGIGLFSVAGSSLALVLIAAELFFIPQPLVFLVVLMIISDSVEYGQWKLGHRDESLTLSVRPLLDKLGGAISNIVVGQIAVIAGMTTGASAASITPEGQMKFKIMMFAVPAAVIVIALIVFFKKITLTEEKHAQIVEELEKNWGKEVLQTPDTTDAQSMVQEEVISISSPVAGELIPLLKVDDPIFASDGLGKGFAIKPTDGTIYAPFDATVRQLFTTRHSIGLVGDNGVVLLIHIGIGTVKLKGEGFVSYVDTGQKVQKGERLITFDDAFIKASGLDDTVIVTVTNTHQYEFIDFVAQPYQLVDNQNDIILKVERE